MGEITQVVVSVENQFGWARMFHTPAEVWEEWDNSGESWVWAESGG